MSEAFRAGGWGMFPTAIAGLFLVAVAIRYVCSPDAGRLRLVRALSAVTLLSSMLGFVAGVIRTFTSFRPAHLGDPDYYREGVFVGHVVHGVGESLYNIGLGLVLLTLTAIIVAFGVSRTRDAGAELTDPLAP